MDTWQKLPLGGVDRRQLVSILAASGAKVAQEDLARDAGNIRPQGLKLPKDHVVVLLGGSGGILRALAIQLILGEGVSVFAVHYDSEKMQIGVHHARALQQLAAERGVFCEFLNADASRPETMEKALAAIRPHFKVAHLINGIASGATKRFAEHGPTQVLDLDVAFDPVRQVADFSSWSALRRVGYVEVEVATQAEIDRTYKLMGHSTEPWADKLAEAGMLLPRVSFVAFSDYEYEPTDPVYAMGPLAGAKVLHRESLARLRERHDVRTLRLCYPAMNTTALGAIPGGLLMFAGSAQLLLERGIYASLPQLAERTMACLAPDSTVTEARLDEAYQSVLPDFHRLKAKLTPETARTLLSRVFENPAL